MAQGDILLNFTEHPDRVMHLVISSDMTQIASMSRTDNNNALIWDYDTGNILTNYANHNDYVNTIDFNKTEKMAVTGSVDKSAQTWNSETGDNIQIYTEHEIGPLTGEVNVVSFSENAGRVLSVGDDGYPHVWNSNTGLVVGVFEAHDYELRSCGYSPAGYCASGTQHIYLWDPDTLSESLDFTEHVGSGVNFIRFSPDNSEIMTGDYSGNLYIWDPDTGNVLLTFTIFTNMMSGDFGPGDYCITSGEMEDNNWYRAKTWERATGNIDYTFNDDNEHGFQMSVRGSHISPDNNNVTTSGDDTIKIWDSGLTEIPLLPAIKYYDGSSWQNIVGLKRYNGSSWVDISTVKEYGGDNWVEL